MPNFNRSAGGTGSTAPPIVSYQNPEDGLVYRRLDTGLPPVHTIAEAELVHRSMAEGPAKDEYNARLTAKRDVIAQRIMGQAIEFGARSLTEVAGANQLTDNHQQRIEQTIVGLREGTTTPDEAADLYDRILREQRGITAQVNAWRSGTKLAADNFADPLGAHDRLVNRFPALRSKRLL